MSSILSGPNVTDAEREAHDQPNLWIVAASLALILVYIYLFTQAYRPLGLPSPEALAATLHLQTDHVFDDDHNVDAAFRISYTSEHSSDDERLIFLLILMAAFLSAYFLPLRYKQPALAFWTSVAILLLYGPAALAGLLLSHTLIYLVLHPVRGRLSGLACAAGALACITFLDHLPDTAGQLLMLALTPFLSALLYHQVLCRLLEHARVAPVIRTVVVQSALITVCIGAVNEGITTTEWRLPLGVLLFFWQWARVMMYHVDYKDGLIPASIRFDQYLPVFLNPGVVTTWQWGVAVGQGYSYVNNRFLNEPKSRIVLSGIRLLLVALGYLLFWNWGTHLLVGVFDTMGIEVFRGRISRMVGHYMAGGTLHTSSVLLTTLLELARWVLLYGGILHFKVGVWRLCGYSVDPYFNRPWLSTNLVTLWSRFTYHYREFLVRCFYYPVFFRFFKRRTKTRIVVATLAAATLGNMIWGHLTEVMYYNGIVFENFRQVFSWWPYFVLLGVGISLAQLHLLRKKSRRKPWTPGPRVILDVLAVYVTLQYYAMLHIFLNPRDGSTVLDLFRIFLIGLGLRF